MRLLLVALAFLAMAAEAGAATLATPTATAALATPAATASPDASQRTDQQQKAPGGQEYERAVTFDGGAQIGTTASGASLLTFVKRGSCTVDVASLTQATVAPTPWPGFVPKVSKVSCTVTGAQVGDTVLTQGLDVYDTDTTNYEALRVSRCKISAADTMLCWLHYSGTAAFDPAPMVINYVVVR